MGSHVLYQGAQDHQGPGSKLVHCVGNTAKQSHQDLTPISLVCCANTIKALQVLQHYALIDKTDCVRACLNVIGLAAAVNITRCC